MKSDNVEVVKAFFAALDRNGDDAARFLSDDFKWDSVVSPEPLDKKAFLEFVGSLFNAAFPDLKRTVSPIEVEGNLVKVTAESVGTHTGPLDLSAAGLPVVPASGKTVRLPSSQLEITVVDDKITLIRNVTPESPDAGIPGMLKALGVTLPAE